MTSLHRRANVLALAALGLLAACPETAPRPTPTPDPAPLIPPATALAPKVSRMVLPNGLAVYLVPNAGAPLVNLQVWVMAGSADENLAAYGPGYGLRGISHFFEHLMFQGTARFPSYDAALKPLGARNNAFTHTDSTVFWLSAPREHLRRILDIEADRFAHLALDFVHVETEREVVKSERRQRTDQSPAELAEERALFDTFDHGPYRVGPIGLPADVDAITLEAVQAYHRAHYVAGGMFLVLAGDFDEAEALADLRELWGNVGAPTPTQPTPAQPTSAPETWVGPRTDHLVRPAAQATALWSFRAPAPSERDFAALEVIDWALTAGKSGRLQRRLVFGDAPRLSSLEASLDPTSRLPRAYLVRAELLPGAEVAEVERALDEELAAVARFGLTADELTAAVQSLRATLIQHTLSNADRGELVAFGVRTEGSTDAFQARLARYAAVTPEDVRRAAAAWLAPSVRVRVVVVAPERLGALVQALTAASPEAAALATLAAQAAQNYLTRERRARQMDDIVSEAHAIYALEERAERALATASPEEAAAIRRYLETAPTGSTQRRARVADAMHARVEEGIAVAAEHAKLQRRFVNIIHKSAAPLGRTPLARAIALLLTDLEDDLPAPAERDAAALAPSPKAIALAVIEGWVLMAHGARTYARGQARFSAAQSAAANVPDADTLTALARALAFDCTVSEGLR